MRGKRNKCMVAKHIISRTGAQLGLREAGTQTFQDGDYMSRYRLISIQLTRGSRINRAHQVAVPEPRLHVLCIWKQGLLLDL